MSLLNALGLTTHKAGVPLAKANGSRTQRQVALSRAQNSWQDTRREMEANVGLLKQALRAACAAEPPAVIAAVNETIAKFDAVFDKLDTRLADSLEKAQAADAEAAASEELQNAKSILASYIVYVQSEPLITQIDSNPFGVNTQLRQTLGKSFSRIAQGIGRVG